MLHVVPALLLLFLQSYPAVNRGIAVERLLIEQITLAESRRDDNQSVANPNNELPDSEESALSIDWVWVRSLLTACVETVEQPPVLAEVEPEPPVVSQVLVFRSTEFRSRSIPVRAGPAV